MSDCLIMLFIYAGLLIGIPVLFILILRFWRALSNWEPPDPETTRSAREASYLMALMGMFGGPPRRH